MAKHRILYIEHVLNIILRKESNVLKQSRHPWPFHTSITNTRQV